MKEVQEMILEEKLNSKPNKRLIQYLQKLNKELVKKLIYKNYKK